MPYLNALMILTFVPTFSYKNCSTNFSKSLPYIFRLLTTILFLLFSFSCWSIIIYRALFTSPSRSDLFCFKFSSSCIYSFSFLLASTSAAFDLCSIFISLSLKLCISLHICTLSYFHFFHLFFRLSVNLSIFSLKIQ